MTFHCLKKEISTFINILEFNSTSLFGRILSKIFRTHRFLDIKEYAKLQKKFKTIS